ncbi:MAG TPA: TadE/TadG family type IV pilus assembly protein [Candidatus Acidoferrales bacterium]|nr:TadE/TadG family type IV pilus assembly protein [Candidatus Acidoferrales bacterium]
MSARVRPAVRRRRDRGQALTEFALVAPIFFLLVFGIVQLGLLFGGQNGLVNAAREVARYAATYKTAITDPAGACSAVEAQIAPALARALPGYDPAQVDPRVEYDWLANPGGTTYSVTVAIHIGYSHPLFVPLVGNLLDGFDGSMDGRLALQADEQMRVESAPLSAPGNPAAPLASCP